jgi:hypothetical protein
LGLAHYKLAWVHVNVGDCPEAFREFEAAMDASRAVAELDSEESAPLEDARVEGEFAVPASRTIEDLVGDYGTLDVQREALVDLTYCYAQVRKPEEAAAYLHGQAASREAYVAALSKMAGRFALIEQPQGAAEVTRELLRLAPDAPERLDDSRMLHSVVRRMEDYSSVGEDVQLILRAMRRQTVGPDRDLESQALLEKEFESLARDLGTRSHRMLQEGLESEWAKEPASVDETARAYVLWLDTFPNSPHRTQIVANLADLLMEGEQFLESGHRYREAAQLLTEWPPPTEVAAREEPTEGEATEGEAQPAPAKTEAQLRAERREALYQAAFAYQQALEQGQAVTRLDRATARAGLRSAGGQYLAEGGAERDKGLAIKFAIGRSYYDEGDLLRAIDLLTALAWEYPGTPEGNAAAHLVLDAYNTSNDIPGLMRVGQRFLAAESPLDAGVKAEISPIVKAAERRMLDDLSLAASGETPGGMEVLLAFAERYEGSDLGEQALLGTFVAARANGDAGLLYSVGEEILKRFPKSEQVAGVASTMGQTAASRYEFDRATHFLGMAADFSTEPRQSAALLLTVGELREQLADEQGALSAYRKAMEVAEDARTRTEAAAHLADLVERWQEPRQVVRTLGSLAEPFDPEISARRGLALLRLGRQEEAELHLRTVVDSPSASAAARARADYGMAEIMMAVLEGFDPLPELEAIEELNGLVEISIQSYLATVRRADPVYGQAALARLARVADIGASQLETMPLPDTLSDEDVRKVREALAQRAAQLREGRDEALAKCAQRARAGYLLDEAGRACESGSPPTRDPVQLRRLAPRQAVDLQGIEESRDRLSRNPDDVFALREVGKAFFLAGDYHAARLALGHLARVGGEGADLDLLGQASEGTGDPLGAMYAYGRAMEAGNPGSAERLAALYAELGLAELAAETRAGGR